MSTETTITSALQSIEPQSAQRKALVYDKAGEEHYNLISALHKSLRDSDPDGALYWLGRMLDAGEDPLDHRHGHHHVAEQLPFVGVRNVTIV